MKKYGSILLSIVLLASMLAGLDLTAQAGTYYESEPNDSYTSANSLPLHSTIYGNCTNSSDYDWYKITLSADSKVDITFTHTQANTSGYWYVNIYKYNGGDSYSELDYAYVYCYDGAYRFPTLGLGKGTYFIRVDSDSYAAGIQYGVTVNQVVPKPGGFKVSTRKTTSLKLGWSKVSGAAGYQLQRKSGDNWKTLTNTSKTSYTVSKLKAGTGYKFRVRAYRTVNGKKYYSSWVNLSTPTKPGTPSIKAPSTSKKKHAITVKWKKLACTGYQVQFSKSSKFKSVIATKTVSGQSKTSYTGKNFTKGKKYYVRVRAYKTVDGKKYYSAWSKTKSITCK